MNAYQCTHSGVVFCLEDITELFYFAHLQIQAVYKMLARKSVISMFSPLPRSTCSFLTRWGVVLGWSPGALSHDPSWLCVNSLLTWLTWEMCVLCGNRPCVCAKSACQPRPSLFTSHSIWNGKGWVSSSNSVHSRSCCSSWSWLCTFPLVYFWSL